MYGYRTTYTIFYINLFHYIFLSGISKSDKWHVYLPVWNKNIFLFCQVNLLSIGRLSLFWMKHIYYISSHFSSHTRRPLQTTHANPHLNPTDSKNMLFCSLLNRLPDYRRINYIITTSDDLCLFIWHWLGSSISKAASAIVTSSRVLAVING